MEKVEDNFFMFRKYSIIQENPRSMTYLVRNKYTGLSSHLNGSASMWAYRKQSAGIQFTSKAKQAKCIPSNFYIIPFLAPRAFFFHDIFCFEEVSDIKCKTNYIPG